MKRYLPFLTAALLPALAALAQTPAADPALPRLLAERRALVAQYTAAQTQRHALFGLTGKPSRQDLQEVVAALQGIVDKDGEIVAVLDRQGRQAQAAASTLQTTGRADRNTSAARLTELQNALQDAQERARQATQRRQELAADLAEARQSRRWRDALIGGLAVLVVAALLWRRR